MRFEGRVALVTGASAGRGATGIGAATAQRLAAEGARVAAADIQGDGARELAAELSGIGLELDVASDESVRRCVDQVESELGPIEVLVNAAGIAGDGTFVVAGDHELWDRVIAVNLRGLMAMTQAVLGGMQERGYGRIVNVASEAGRLGSQLSGSYSAAKAGVIGFTKTVAREAARYNVTANCVAPGPIETPMLNQTLEIGGDLGERFVKGMVGSTAMGRPGRPEEVAAAIAFLASEDASYVTGETIGVSGGMGML